jgi:hypothetical protein
MPTKKVRPSDLSRPAFVPRALSLFLSFSLAAPVLAQDIVSPASQAPTSQAPGWNEIGSDSLFGQPTVLTPSQPQVQAPVQAKAQSEKTQSTDAKAAPVVIESISKVEQSEKTEKLEKAEKSEKTEKTEKLGKSESLEKSEKLEKAELEGSANGKAIAEVNHSSSAPTPSSDAALIAPAALPAATVIPAAAVIPKAESAAVVPAADAAAVVPAAGAAPASEAAALAPATAPRLEEKAASGDEPLVVDSDSAAAKTESAPSTLSPTSEAVPALPASSAEGFGLGQGSVLAPDGKNLLGTTSDAPPKVGESGALTTADSLSPEMLTELGATVVDINAKTVTSSADGIDGPMVVDCDEAADVQSTVQYENLPTDDGKTKIKAGARFPVVVISQISSKTSHVGDPVEARLKYDLKIGDRLVAKKGSVVRGHINYSLKARSVMHSLVSPERWYRNSGCLGVEFDEIITEKGEHLPLVACPAKTARIVKNKGEGRVLGVNHLGQVAGPWDQQLKYKAVRIGLNAAMAPVGVFSFGAMPVALGLIGAANPSFAFMKPVGTNVRHRRLKGFAWGFLSGIPGSWLIEDTVTKGNEAIIKPGDEFLAEFRQEFNGEPASEAQLMPNAKAKVHGDVRTKEKKK